MEMRRVYTTAAPRVRCDGTGVKERDESRRMYRKAPLKWKKAYWDEFLASAKKNDVWTAHQFTKIRVPSRVPSRGKSTPEATEEMIMSHFFPPGDNPARVTPARRHDTGQRDDLTAIAEISTVLAKGNKGSVAGFD